MSYILIAKEAHTLPYAVKLDEKSVDKAMSKVKSMASRDKKPLFQPQFLIDLSTGDIQRVVKKEDGYTLVDRAFEANLGSATPDEYFTQQVSTQEIIQ